ncbi:MAG: UvrB/UvrC motif-containing protein [Pirellulales bacterium]
MLSANMLHPPMKCQHCEKPATFHITELTGSEPQEVHLCEDHAQLFLSASQGDGSMDDESAESEPGASSAGPSTATGGSAAGPSATGGTSATGGSAAAGGSASSSSGSSSGAGSKGSGKGGKSKKPQKVAQTAEDLAKIDQRTCPKCGITFHEFRQQGRLGCPHDYDFFQRELEPLLVNIHGDRKHVGKRPRHGGGNQQLQAELARLRREMRDAVAREDYETASLLRDQIRQLDKDGGNP